MTQLDCQLDLLDLIDDPPTKTGPPFTVFSCVWTLKGCGWCGSRNTIGGGARRNPDDDAESWFFEYCQKCVTRYGHPHPGHVHGKAA